MTKYNLFDKIIDVEFTQDKPAVYGEVETFDTGDNSKSLFFKCPRKGIKPNVELYIELLPNTNTNAMTVKMVNLYSEINIARYKYIRVRAGYGMNDGEYAIFKGEVMNCYVEKPNPEGTTVFTCVLGAVSQFLENTEPVEIMIPDMSTVSIMVANLADAFKLEYSINLPNDWMGLSIVTNNATQTFANALVMQTWLKSTLDTIAAAKKLSKLYVTVTDNLVYISPMTVDYIGQETIILDKITTAYFMGGNIVVNAPWNPKLSTGKLFQMDTKYFRGRMGSLFVKGEKKLFNPYHIKLSFSTTNQNSMEISAVDTSIAMEEITQ